MINISTKTSYLLHILQVIYSENDRTRIAEKKEKTKLGGTPQGKQRTKLGKNLPKGRKIKETKGTKIKENLTASFRVFKDFFTSSISLLKNLLPEIKIAYLVADTAYGSLDYLKIAQEYGCNLISKMKSNVALYEPAKKEKGKKGRPPLYGNKMDLAK